MTSEGGAGRIADEVERLAAAVRGGRVAHSDFLDPADADALAAELRRRGVALALDGGFPGARRRLVTAHPEHIPHATTPMTGVYLEGPFAPDEVRAAARAAGVPAGALGDTVAHTDGVSLVVLEPVPPELLALRRVAGRPVEPAVVPLERVAGGSVRRQEVVVPSLRVDALGAKAFRVSRSYFAKGVAAGRVSVNGEPAGKSAEAGVGDEVFADGLGRFRVVSIERETRRGNTAVVLEVERA